MASISEKELDAKRQKNDRLREQIAAAEATAAERQADVSNEIAAAELDAETARLEAQLAAAKQAAKVSVAREGASSNLSSVKEQLEAAQTGITPPGVAVDTNAGSDSADENKE